MKIRDAIETDLPAICAIYNDAVANTTAIWNETLVDIANRATWLDARNTAGFPVLVALSGTGEVVGYASFGEWRAFDGYRHTVEHSVYVRADQRGGGIGRALMLELIGRADALGKHVMIAGIESGNLPSIRLHEQLGFRQTGHMKEVGTKFGGTVGYFVPEARFRHWLTNLSPNATANCVLASNHSRGGRFHCSAA